ncbi:MAG: YdbH domain-containing protein, partial [Alphaproteobacteria bacterium]
HGHFPPLVVPVRALASLRTEDDHRVTFALELADASGRLALNAEGHHDMTRGSGELRGQLKRLTFLPTVLEPSRLFPVLAGKFEEVDGAVDATGRISWDGGEPVSSLDLLVEVKRLTTGEITVENANTIVHFDSLFPPTTPPGQEILVGLIDVGVPMTRGRLLFQLRGDGSVEVELDELLLFGGSIGSEPFRLSPTDPNFAVDLEVSGVQLARILKLAEYGDFSATGLLDGTIPVVVENGEVAIRGGVLETRAGGGTLSYHPKEVGSALTEVDASTALFLDAIENFQYDTIRVSLDEGEAEELVLGLSLKGRNPDVYGGVPFALNVTITGPLDAILSRGLATYTLPERIRERILEFGD